MKLTNFNKGLIISIIFGILFYFSIIKQWNNEYNTWFFKENLVQCEVLSTHDKMTSGKYPRVKNILILKDKSAGHKFSLDVNEVTYYDAKQGVKNMSFSLTGEEMGINPPKGVLTYRPHLLFFIIICFAAALALYYSWKDVKK